MLAVFFLITIPISAYAVDGQIKIAQTPSTTFPIVIDQPGSYVLTSNIVVPATDVNGIWIKTGNVTIDFNGHTVTGPGRESGTWGNGVHHSVHGNITIKNGTVENFRGYGLDLDLCQNCQVTDMKVTENGTGGIRTFFSTITNITALNNYNFGIDAFHSTISNCMAYGNGDGINATSSTVTNCTTNANVGRGIAAWSSTITNCTATLNGGDGIHAVEKSRVEGNNLRDNGGYGLYLRTLHNYAVKNTASGNTGGNFYSGDPSNYMPTSLTGPDAANANIGW
ncbi:MAG: right-handed parallel beta-helix repeat-containing protein [Nitrospirota bacterium]